MGLALSRKFRSSSMVAYGAEPSPLSFCHVMFPCRAVLSAFGFSGNLLMQAEAGQQFQTRAILVQDINKTILNGYRSTLYLSVVPSHISKSILKSTSARSNLMCFLMMRLMSLADLQTRKP